MKNSLFNAIYVETQILDHPRTLEVLQAYPDKPVIPINHYGEVFNRKAQNFRLQKQNPSLILAKKDSPFLHKIPEQYSIGCKHNYYFSHFLNCPYDCSYCFLQGMYQSAHFVFFVNFEDFEEAIVKAIKSHPQESFSFFSGYDADSLALDKLTGFSKYFTNVFQKFPNAQLELRTKSLNISTLLKQPASKNIIVAYTLSPEKIIKPFEKKTPSLKLRLNRIKQLQSCNYPIGLRFDPIIYHKNYENTYEAFFEEVFDVIDLSLLHSVTLGTFRLPKGVFKQMKKNDPQSRLLATCSEAGSSMVSYTEKQQDNLLNFCENILLRYIPKSKLFICN